MACGAFCVAYCLRMALEVVLSVWVVVGHDVDVRGDVNVAVDSYM